MALRLGCGRPVDGHAACSVQQLTVIRGPVVLHCISDQQKRGSQILAACYPF